MGHEPGKWKSDDDIGGVILGVIIIIVLIMIFK